MKRASILGALAVLAGFFFAAAPAHAYTINCSNVTSTLTVYPYNGAAQKCGTVASSAGTLMAGTLYDMIVGAPDAYNKFSAGGSSVKFYMFKNPAEYDQFFDERKANPPAGTTAADWDHPEPGTGMGQIGPRVFGTTFKTTAGVPKWTAIFNFDFAGANVNTYSDIQYTTGHEAGHWLEYYYRNIVQSGTFSAAYARIYLDLLARDWINFNALAKCGIGGVFNGRADANGAWMCSGGVHNQLPMLSPYSASYSNEINLNFAHPTIFGDVREVFASEVTRLVGYTDDPPRGIAVYNEKFTCSQYLVGKLIQNGILPTVTQLNQVNKVGGGSANCPTSGTGWPTLAP